ncbi:hypothetical protein Mgra_00002030 [Meloidogyne graminicola]|uniref:Uncharacterized protein n=1 Tax=Meloidogyne graminicola TaxID=189291 RepID=A0A8S9ZZB2_9BILA|nr:hypothetical protein Mgra_00002030 [Meloidogyne graminicola]
MVNVNVSKLLFTTTTIDENEEEKQKRLFILGLMILFGWILIIVFCVYPKLIYKLIINYLCCCFKNLLSNKQQNNNLENLNNLKEKERIRTTNKTFIGLSLATTSPSNILLKQVGFEGNMVEYDVQRKKFVSASIAVPEILENEDIEYRESEEEDEIERAKRESKKSKNSKKLTFK